MRVLFLIGGTASGKSLAGATLAALGAERIDLDQVSRAVLSREPDCVAELVEAFGSQILDDPASWRGEGSQDYAPSINRAALARCAFGSSEDTQRLESIEMPYIKAHLADLLTPVSCSVPGPDAMVVEVPLPDRLQDLMPLADAIVYVRTPLERRRHLAQARGMDPKDFDERIAHQPTDEWCVSAATDIIENDGTASQLESRVTQWYEHWLQEDAHTAKLTKPQESSCDACLPEASHGGEVTISCERIDAAKEESQG